VRMRPRQGCVRLLGLVGVMLPRTSDRIATTTARMYACGSRPKSERAVLSSAQRTAE
jgi:hypothetical protein